MKTASIALTRAQDRHVLFAFIAGLAITLCWRGFAHAPGATEALSLLQDRSGVSVAELLAFGALLSLVFQFRDEDFLSAGELVVLAIASIAFATPPRFAAIVPLTIVGFMFLRRQDPRLRSIGQLLLALVFYEWIGQILFYVVSPFALRAETMAVWALLSFFQSGQFTMADLAIIAKNGDGIYVELPCSAFHNLSAATLIWISLVKLETNTINRVHWRILAAMAAATVVLNTLRIALMAQSHSMYEYWHNGSGVSIVSFSMLAAILCVFLGGRTFVSQQ
jgi:hypothetical protein